MCFAQGKDIIFSLIFFAYCLKGL